jgi:hypothetical protein
MIDHLRKARRESSPASISECAPEGYVMAVLLATLLSLAMFALALLAPGRSLGAEPFGIKNFGYSIETERGGLATQAGSHPYAMTTAFEFATHKPGELEEEIGLEPAPNGLAKEVEVDLPAGVTANPNASTVKCAEAELDGIFRCPDASAVGVATLHLAIEHGAPYGRTAVYSMIPPSGVPAELGLEVDGIVIHIVGNARTGSDYGLSARTSDILEKGASYSAALTLWGDPSASIHNEERGLCAASSPAEKQIGREKWETNLRAADEARKKAIENGEPVPPLPPEAEEGYYLFNCPVQQTNTPFLTLPSICTGDPLVATMSADSWDEPNRFLSAEASSPAVTGCEALSFEPSLSVSPIEPEGVVGESPAGLEVDLKVPREESLENLAESDLKEAVVTLPAGMTVSPSAANGLATCPLLRGAEKEKEELEERHEEVGVDLESKQPANCPNASKLGTVEVVTPLLEHPLQGAVYLAQQGNLVGAGSNPFGSLFALYVVAEGSGVVVKLPGEIELNSSTGQLTARFGKDPATSVSTGTEQFLPQLPFSELKMHFFGGPKAPLVTPSSCGRYTTTSALTPYSSETAKEPSSSFTVASGCGPRGFSPTLTAGTASHQAGEDSEEIVTIARSDGEQDLSSVTVTMPPGLLGNISTVPLCGEPQASQGTCGEGSLIGETTVATGPGEDPYWVRGGKVYLTSSYDHEPFGLSIVVPTVAGPFTLEGEHGGVGKEVVRASIAVNPKTDALTVASGPLPHILEGVPLDIRTINVDINRKGFTFNPKNCEEMHVMSSITSTEGATATPSSRFQAANCAALPLKPVLSASTRGNGSDRGNGASLNVKITERSGEAGIRSVHLELPRKLPARLSTLQKACTEATFDADPANCPASSDVGTGIAHTPVLPVPLEGPAYFVSHGGAEYPELVFVLQGDGVTIDLAGETHINSKTKITSSTFGTVPDAPISSFEANLPEEPNSALATLTPKGLCGSASLSMPTTIIGQNGAEIKQATKVAITGCPKKLSKSTKKHKRKPHKQGKARAKGKKAGGRS